ncbi:GDP-L-fucose synthase family protein [candidate division CSSED10-310 bacterium]|uniref:GDP-L-fucose synthase n=1 Tax=candidate division CSSED10-310 bacterium TaxID=2855610 RepID=A0ABV6Z341_UNCC1
MLDRKRLVYVAGHEGMVGSALLRRLKEKGFTNFVLRTLAELDLTDSVATREFFAQTLPDYVFLAAAQVGGIYANNTYPADFIWNNLSIQCNVLKNAMDCKVRKLLFLGSSCIYPRMAPQPMREEYLLTGLLEETNEPYAIAKISGIITCQSFNRQYGTNFISVMPTNLFGPNDNYDPLNSHVLPAMIRRFHEARLQNRERVICWGTGAARREFLHVDDLADACCFLMDHYSDSGIINIGTGEDLSVKELAEMIARVVGYQGTIEWDHSKPDGTPRKLLDVTGLTKLGWKYSIPLELGIQTTYQDFLKQGNEARGMNIRLDE